MQKRNQLRNLALILILSTSLIAGPSGFYHWGYNDGYQDRDDEQKQTLEFLDSLGLCDYFEAMSIRLQCGWYKEQEEISWKP